MVIKAIINAGANDIIEEQDFSDMSVVQRLFPMFSFPVILNKTVLNRLENYSDHTRDYILSLKSEFGNPKTVAELFLLPYKFHLHHSSDKPDKKGVNAIFTKMKSNWGEVSRQLKYDKRESDEMLENLLNTLGFIFARSFYGQLQFTTEPRLLKLGFPKDDIRMLDDYLKLKDGVDDMVSTMIAVLPPRLPTLSTTTEEIGGMVSNYEILW